MFSGLTGGLFMTRPVFDSYLQFFDGDF